MDDQLFGERRRALEEEFFKRHNEELLSAMRARLETERLAETLGGATGITDADVIAHLAEAGMTGATVMAIALVPLVAVAWADGRLEEAERLRIIRDPETHALSGEARALLLNWLIEQPEPSLFETWSEYLHAIRPNLGRAGWDRLKEATVARAHAVAAAASGEPYGLGREIAREEQVVLNRIEAAFAG